jgi:hypothetical protein
MKVLVPLSLRICLRGTIRLTINGATMRTPKLGPQVVVEVILVVVLHLGLIGRRNPSLLLVVQERLQEHVDRVQVRAGHRTVRGELIRTHGVHERMSGVKKRW